MSRCAPKAPPWQPTARAGVAVRPLYSQAGFVDSMRLERWSAGREPRPRRRMRPAPSYSSLDGSFADEDGTFASRRVAAVAARRSARAGDSEGCLLYIKEGGFAYLRAG